MHNILLLLLTSSIVLVSSCMPGKHDKPIDIQGHRGFCGMFPENSIPGFIAAADAGVNTIEMDVVFSKDQEIIISHEPFLSHEICMTADGSLISEDDEKLFNLYQMFAEEIKVCDCGTKPHPIFKEQKKMFTYKPRLADVIDSVETYIKSADRKPVTYSIEIKTTPGGDNIFHPDPQTVVRILTGLLDQKGITNRVIVQSYDVRPLKLLKEKFPNVKIALLVENKDGYQANIGKLGFNPDIYSPDYKLLKNENNPDVKGLFEFAEKNHIKIVVWTVNEPEDMMRLVNMGIDGIITDFPDRAIEALKSKVTIE